MHKTKLRTAVFLSSLVVGLAPISAAARPGEPIELNQVTPKPPPCRPPRTPRSPPVAPQSRARRTRRASDRRHRRPRVHALVREQHARPTGRVTSPRSPTTVGSLLGFDHKDVKWVTEPFDSSYAPGPKAFDFDINEISVTPDRSKVVTFSVSYYDTTQSIVALKSDAIVTHHSPAELKTYLYGDQIGTTGLAYIYAKIHPTRAPRVYNTLDEAVAALQTKQVDAIIVDTPDGQYMASSEVKNGVQVGQFPSTGEHYGLLFHKGNPLASCVDSALTAMTRDGALAKLSKQYLGIYNSVPTIEP